MPRDDVDPDRPEEPNQRSNAIPYDRCVIAGRPHADSSANNADTATTGTPAASSNRNGPNGSPVACSDPRCGTTKPASSPPGRSSSLDHEPGT